MRILLAHNNYSIKGGADVFVHEVARVIQQHGHEVAFLAGYEDGIQSEWQDYFPKVVDYTHHKFAAVLRFPKLVYSHESRIAARNLIRDFKPDLAHCFSIYTKLTPSILDEFKAAGIPVVSSLNDYKHICPNYKLFHHGKVCEACQGRHFGQAIRNRCAHDSLVFSTAVALEAYVHRFLDIYRKNIDLFLFSSEFMARKTEEFWGAESFRWRLLRNPFDSTRFEMSEHVGNYALYFGRHIEEKGVDVLLRAAAIASDIPVYIVGDGPSRGDLENQARGSNLTNVKFMGEKWGKDMDRIIEESRFVVVPSLWHENFPYVVLQAFAMGKPVIGANRGGIPELIQDGERGYVYDAIDPSQLAAHMVALGTSDADVCRMGRNAKEYADAEFNDGRFYTRLEKIYSEVLA